MAAGEIHVGDPTVFDFTLGDLDPAGDIEAVSLVGATIAVHFQRPNLSSFQLPASIVDANAGTFTVTMLTTSFNVAGEWALQAIVSLPGGPWHTDKYFFTVHSNIA